VGTAAKEVVRRDYAHSFYLADQSYVAQKPSESPVFGVFEDKRHINAVAT
jgi:hypothetical protein